MNPFARHSPPTPVPLNAPSSTEPVMAWFKFRNGTVLDFPLHTTQQARTWAATMWPERRAPGGWARHFWAPGDSGRGFVPELVDLGDVVQFGVQHTPEQVTQWIGYLHAVRPDSLLIHGPHPTPQDAHAAAQLAFVHHIHQPVPGIGETHRPTGAIELPGADPATVAITPAQPPAQVNVTFHGPRATVGDPEHGWLVVDTATLLAAMSHTPEHLIGLLRGQQLRLRLRLDGREPPLTLAALAAYHLPDQLFLRTTPTPDIPASQGIPTSATTPAATPRPPDSTADASGQPAGPTPPAMAEEAADPNTIWTPPDHTTDPPTPEASL